MTTNGDDFGEDDLEQLPPVSVGEVLQEEFMTPLNLSAASLAEQTCIPLDDLTKLLAGRLAMTTEIADALAIRFGTSSEMWMEIQKADDYEKSYRKSKKRR